MVDEDHIADIVARWTDILAREPLEGEREKLFPFNELLRRGLMWQDESVDTLTNALIETLSEPGNHNRPIGSFIYLRPMDFGKTELGRLLDEFLSNYEANMVRRDMSEYIEKLVVAHLIRPIRAMALAAN